MPFQGFHLEKLGDRELDSPVYAVISSKLSFVVLRPSSELVDKMIEQERIRSHRPLTKERPTIRSTDQGIQSFTSDLWGQECKSLIAELFRHRIPSKPENNGPE
jgi:hypothetical protein